MKLAGDSDTLSGPLDAARREGRRVGLVPTMGFLHEGHLSLVDLARERSDLLAVSIFVNPLQFGPDEDLEQYPRDLQKDLSLLDDRGVDVVFAPSVEAMYPHGPPQVTLDPGPMGRRLCGRFRPDHFRGVLTVVARLFGLFRPDLAVFGQKDFQQAVLIRRMAQDLHLGVDVVMGPIVRDEDGLALSSRNVYLSPEERAEAVGLREALMAVQSGFHQGIRSSARLESILEEELEPYPLLSLQYGEIVDPLTLEPLPDAHAGAAVVLAAHCGGTRLIDNHILEN